MLLAESFATTMAPPQHDSYAASHVAEKVMRRIEIAKVGYHRWTSTVLRLTHNFRLLEIYRIV
jgi:hypothetical protein